MKKILCTYSILTTISFCIVLLLVGVIISENNTRKLSFGEEYEAVQIYSTNDEFIGVSSGERNMGITNDILNKTKSIVMKIRPFFSPVINNWIWFTQSIQELF